MRRATSDRSRGRASSGAPRELPDARAPKNRTRRGSAFERRVAGALRKEGFVVEGEQLVGGDRIDRVARHPDSLSVFLVECKSENAGTSKHTIERHREWTSGDEARRLSARAMVVALRLAPAARRHAKDHGVAAFTLDELESGGIDWSLYLPDVVDWRPYLAHVLHTYSESTLSRDGYVPQRLRPSAAAASSPDDLITRAVTWSRGADRRLWLVLGDWGTGKSTFVQQLEFVLAQAARGDRTAPIPVAIDLRDAPRAESIEELVKPLLDSRLARPVDRALIRHLIATGRIVPLLDSFDEMGLALAGRSLEEQFRLMARPTGTVPQARFPHGNRVLITSRTGLFRDEQHASRAAEGRLPGLESPPGSPLGRLARDFEATIDEIREFDGEQIEQFVRGRVEHGRVDEVLRLIGTTYDLGGLAPRAVMLQMILESIDELRNSKGTIAPAHLYDAYTSRWLSGLAGRSLRTKPEARKALLRMLAFELWGLPQARIHHTDLVKVLQDHALELPEGIDVNVVETELRTAAFLTRTPNGHYGFSHKSFLEFFYALRLLDALRRGPEALADALDTEPLTPETVAFLLDLLDATKLELDRLAEGTKGILSSPYRPRASENALRLGYWAAELPRVRAARGGAGASASHAWPCDRFVPSGANLHGAVLREWHAGELWLHAADLREANLAGSRLGFVNIEDADLAGADLTNTQLSTAIASGARFVGAILFATDLRNATLEGADFSSAQFTRADLRGAYCRGSRFDRASMHGVRLGRATLIGCSWTDARVLRCTAPEATSPPPQIRELPPRLAHRFARGPQRGLQSVALSPDASVAVTGHGDGSIMAWDATTGEELWSSSGHESHVGACVVSRDGSTILSGGFDHVARVWDAATGAELQVLRGHRLEVTACAFDEEGRRAVTGSSDYSARVWDWQRGVELRVLTGHEATVNACAFSRDGNKVLTGAWDLTARVWDIASGRVIGGVRWQKPETVLAFAIDGDLALTGDESGDARIWGVETRELRRAVRAHEFELDFGAFAAHDALVLTGDLNGNAGIWNAATGQELRKFTPIDSGAHSLAISSDGTRLLQASSTNDLRLWNTSSGQLVCVWRVPVSAVTSCAFASHASRVVTGHDDGTAREWDAATGTVRYVLGRHGGAVQACSWLREDSEISTASADGSVRLWRGATGSTEFGLLNDRARTVVACSATPDGARVLTGDKAGVVQVWCAATGRELGRFQGHGSEVSSLAVSPSGARLLAGHHDGCIRLWDVVGGTALEVTGLQDGRVTACAFAPDGLTAVTGGSDGMARVIDTTSGASSLLLRGHTGWIDCCAFSPHGRSILTAGADGTARTWDSATGILRRVLRGHVGPITCCAYGPEGTQILTSSLDGTARIWDAATGECLLILSAGDNGWLAVDAQGRWRGEGEAVDRLRYFDPEERSLLPTIWYASDLPQMRMPDDFRISVPAPAAAPPSPP